MKREKHTMHLDEGAIGFANDPIISYRHGYIWIGNNAPGDMRCYATLEEGKAVRMARAILKRAAEPPA